MRFFSTAILLLGLAPSARAATTEQIEFFESRIRPVLAQDCYECHNSNGKAKGKLILDHREPMMKGGASGPSIVPGNADESLLIQAIRHEFDDLQMPKAGVMLDEAIIADFVTWINMGAPDPRDAPPTEADLAEDASWDAILERRKAWWSFQPIPDSVELAGTGHPVDELVQTKLEDAGLKPSPKADPTVLARRLSFALTGLPPTTEQIAHFEDVGFDQAVEELLASPQFGEKWARHWMDWIRYAETHGSEGDPAIPNAHLYRDYLIRALNADVPYDQLLREHVAGDLLTEPRIDPELAINESLIGTAHWRMVFHGFAPTDALDEKVRFTDDQINVFTKAFLGLTVSCARCHNHKFDAISQADYYAMFGIFGSTRPSSAAIELPENRRIHQETLTALKPQIRNAIAEDWLATELKLEGETPPKGKAPSEPEGVVKRWDLTDPATYQKWFRQGDGLTGVAEPGDFVVATKGDNALAEIYPGGIYSHLISDKHGAILTSPDFHLDGEYELYLNITGGGSAMARYVVQNYPRRGTVYKTTELKKDAKNPGWRWQRFDLTYWNGDDIHIEIVTAKDSPLLVKNSDRSWFGIREALLVKKGSPAPQNPAPPTVVEGDLRKAIEAWREGNATDDQARLLDAALKDGILPNQLAQLPTAKSLLEQYRKLEAEIPVATRIATLAEWKGQDQPLFDRGDHKKPLEEIPRRFLDAIDNTPYQSAGSGRLELAEDLLRTDNPFTRRVIVNRIWHHLFGNGIVPTTDNFGRLGAEPTHPELLDYLAGRFSTEDDWSLKSLIRFLVTSETWQQSSQPSDLAKQTDPANALLSHANVRRLDAEAIRDQFLAVSGALDFTRYGPPQSGSSNRRSVYVSVIRNRLDPFLAAFDAPVPFSTTGTRSVTNVPAQSLMLLNNDFVTSAATRLASSTAGEPAARIRQMWKRALGRYPTAAEASAANGFVSNLETRYADLQREQTELAQRIETANAKKQAILLPIREHLEATLPDSDVPSGPTPLAHWTFDDFQDALGNLHAQAKGQAKLEKGSLVVNGDGFVATAPLETDLKAKTLDAVVLLSSLDQRGGGVMTVQETSGNAFDAIVFGEHTAGHWIAGSNHFYRTQPLQGTAEQEADTTPVRITITYAADGTIRAYRNGQPYGKAYRKAETLVFPAGKSQVLFGLRHGNAASGNRALRGSILEAKLYDRALSPEEVRAATSAYVSESMILGALSDAAKQQLQRLDAEIRNLQTERDQRRHSIASDQAWIDLAHSIFNLKEFIYVR